MHPLTADEDLKSFDGLQYPAEVDQAPAPAVPAASPGPSLAADAVEQPETPAGSLIDLDAAAGLVSGLIGVGGGFIVVPWLARHTRLDARSGVVTSMAVVALLFLGGVAAAAAHGSITGAAVGPFALGAICALLLGRPWMVRLSAARLQQAFAGLCFVAAGLLLLRGLGWMHL